LWIISRKDLVPYPGAGQEVYGAGERFFFFFFAGGRSGIHGLVSIASPIVLKDIRTLECGCPRISRNARPIDIVAIKRR
jgi:hypothetical protein